jgi:hypothetical protein
MCKCLVAHNHTFPSSRADILWHHSLTQVGSILIAPLIKRFPTRTVLSYAVLTFGLISMTLLICDAATGGKPKILNGGKQKYGTWNPNGLFPIYIISGVAYGMVELIRRVIPRNIVAGDVQRVSLATGRVWFYFL